MTGKRAGSRGKCPYCGRHFSVNKDGKLRKHGKRPGVFCGGSGQRPS